MLRLKLLAAWALCACVAVSSERVKMPSIYDFTAMDIHGTKVPLEKHRARFALVVNVASDDDQADRQYFALQALHELYHHRGLKILAFPCDEIDNLEDMPEDEIYTHVTGNYGVEFPMFSKVEVNGPSAHPVFSHLKETTGGGDVKTNFEKFLVVNGQPVKRYPGVVNPSDIRPDIEDVLRGYKVKKSLRQQIHSTTTHDGAPTREELEQWDVLNKPSEAELDTHDNRNGYEPNPEWDKENLEDPAYGEYKEL